MIHLDSNIFLDTQKKLSNLGAFQMFPDTQGFVPIPPDDTSQPAEIKNTIVFDYKTNRFRVIDGKPQTRDGAVAVRQWIELMLRTYLHRFTVYAGTQFGHTGEDLIGMRQAPSGYLHSELAREIREACALCPAIRQAHDFSFSRQGRSLLVHFTVTLRTGEQEEVIHNVTRFYS